MVGELEKLAKPKEPSMTRLNPETFLKDYQRSIFLNFFFFQNFINYNFYFYIIFLHFSLNKTKFYSIDFFLQLHFVALVVLYYCSYKWIESSIGSYLINSSKKSRSRFERDNFVFLRHEVKCFNIFISFSRQHGRSFRWSFFITFPTVHQSPCHFSLLFPRNYFQSVAVFPSRFYRVKRRTRCFSHRNHRLGSHRKSQSSPAGFFCTWRPLKAAGDWSRGVQRTPPWLAKRPSFVCETMVHAASAHLACQPNDNLFRCLIY